jgi:hypothetical protein
MFHFARQSKGKPLHAINDLSRKRQLSSAEEVVALNNHLSLGLFTPMQATIPRSGWKSKDATIVA